MIRIFWLVLSPNVLATDFYGYHNLGRLLATGGTTWTMPGNSYWPPGYPFFLGILYYALGPNPAIARIANLVLGVASVALVYLIAKQVASEKTALLASTIYACLPTAVLYTSIVGTETLFTFLLLAFFYMWLRIKDSELDLTIFTGVILGLAGLVRAQALPLAVVLAPFTFGLGAIKDKALLKKMAVVTLAAFVVVLPWLVRTQVMYGTFNMQVNGGVFFWQGNHENVPLPNGEYPWDSTSLPYDPITADFYYRHPVEASQWGMEKATQYILNNPGEATVNVFLKGYYFLASEPDGLIWNRLDDNKLQGPTSYRPVNFFGADASDRLKAFENISYWILVVLALGGMAVSIRERKSWFLMASIGYWLIIHALTISLIRYRFPMLPIFAIYGSAFLPLIGTRISRLRTGIVQPDQAVPDKPVKPPAAQKKTAKPKKPKEKART
ncbi:MAG: ArnT family glycosyltransferase [Candidatus Aquicultorales bacterium]